MLGWAIERLHEPVHHPAAGPSRQDEHQDFTRRFRHETGLTPIGWLTRQRLDRARELLETTRLPVDAVAERSGFSTGNGLRQHFTKVLGTTPSAYRRAFRSVGDTE
ncbi:helix-turn-helix domain-containing protein [Nonomuraea dietziae]|uniref:helix-turn-helix domain-containing protein n=1 Tax=Nonomuraea dietziae TaxID=65515 RepID=UPI0031E34006